MSGDEEEIEDLLDKGADINWTNIDGVTALHQVNIIYLYPNKLNKIRF